MPRDDVLVLVQRTVRRARVREQCGHVGTARFLGRISSIRTGMQRGIQCEIGGWGEFVAEQGRLGGVGRRRHAGVARSALGLKGDCGTRK